MEINVPIRLVKNIELASKNLGLSKKEIISRAILLYLSNLEDFKTLQAELDSWEETSEEDLFEFNKQNNL